MKPKKQKKPNRKKQLGYWLQVLGALLTGIGTFLAGLAEILKIILRSE